MKTPHENSTSRPSGEGKVAIVTGGSSGIGAAISRHLAAAGMTVVVTARSLERLDSIVGEIRESGGTAHALQSDVSSWAACQELVSRVVDAHGRLDVLVNCAGVMFMARVENADPSEWATMMNTNVLGSMFMAKAALPHLLETKGAVVQLSSAAGRVARVNTAGYCASKYAITAFCDALRQEVGSDGVRVIVLEPGSTNTNLRMSITDKQVLEAVSARSQAIEQLEAEDVAVFVTFALSQPPRVAFNEVLFRPTQQDW